MDPRARLAAALGACVAGVVAIWAATATSCVGSSAAGPSSPAATATSDERCAVELEPTPFEPTPPPSRPSPSSRVTVELAVAETALERILDARIPKGLGSATGKPIGAPGEVSYRVSRGAPEVALVADALEVKVPIHAAVEVCKPIGRLCPIYGTCQPNLVATTRVPLRLDADYGIEPAKIDVRVTTGCRIAGFDVTGEVQSAAAGARRTAERQIADAIPDLRALLAEAMRTLEHPVRVDEHCLRITPRTIRQGPVRSVEGRLKMAVEVEGHVEPAECGARFPAPTLPPLSRLEGRAEPSQLVLLRPVEEDVIESLRATAPNGLEAVVLAMAPHVADDRSDAAPQLALELKLDGRVCGTLWALATPELRDGALVMRDLIPASSIEGGGDVLTGVALRSDGIGTGDLGSRLAERLRGATSELAAAMPELQGLAIDLDVEGLEAASEAVVIRRGVAERAWTRGRLRIVVDAATTR